ncbi:MAG: SDR family oxidoreductase [Gemmatimonadota bacterium]|nr:SDR family oxidoreductase [Gemmatimonadota bacterium]
MNGAGMENGMEGRTAVVTGSSKGIGLAIAEAMVDAGMDVVISARNAEEVEEAASRLNARGAGRAVGQTCDVRDAAEVARLVERAVAEFGGLDVLVNNAGVGGSAPVDQLSVEKWDQIIETNLSGVFYACREAIPHLRRRGGGWIINIASLAGKQSMAGGGAYNASKFGLVGFSEALMLDVREDDIRVNYIMPGSVNTHFFEGGPRDENVWMLQPEDIAQTVMDLLRFPSRALPSRIEIRPTRPPKK